jgi:hypothetical protein
VVFSMRFERGIWSILYSTLTRLPFSIQLKWASFWKIATWLTYFSIILPGRAHVPDVRIRSFLIQPLVGEAP